MAGKFSLFSTLGMLENLVLGYLELVIFTVMTWVQSASQMLFLSNYIEEILVSAISYHLMNTKDPDYRNGKLVISSKRSNFFVLLFCL